MSTTRTSFDSQIHDLEQNVGRLGAVVAEMLGLAMRSLMTQDVALAESVARQDDVADGLDLEIEQQCVRLIALQQPLSKDLRIIATIMKVISDLERIGDYSVDIAKTGQRIAGTPYFEPMVDLPLIGEQVERLIWSTLRAFIERDVELAQRCIDDDDEIDDLHSRLFEELLDIMQERPETVPQAARFLLTSRYLERIADHCTNIAERIFYMETGHAQRS